MSSLQLMVERKCFARDALVVVFNTRDTVVPFTEFGCSGDLTSRWIIFH